MRLIPISLFCTLATAPTISLADDIDAGRALVETNCAGCHAVANTDASRHPDAPPLRILSQRYPLENLEEAFAEGISTGHPDMPEFIATPEQIAAILAYIGSLQAP